VQNLLREGAEFDKKRLYQLVSLDSKERAELEQEKTECEDRTTLLVNLGDVNRDNQAGNVYNAVDELICYFQNHTTLSDDMFARVLRLYAEGLEEG
jgi:hypothetical protein